MGLMIGWPCSQRSDNILIIEKPKAITPTNGLRSVSIDQDPVPLQTQPGPMKPPIIDSLFFYSFFLLLVSVFLSLSVLLYFCVSQCKLLDVLYGETRARRGLWALLLSKKFITKPGISAEEWLSSSPLLSAFLYGPSLSFWFKWQNWIDQFSYPIQGSTSLLWLLCLRFFVMVILMCLFESNWTCTWRRETSSRSSSPAVTESTFAITSIF